MLLCAYKRRAGALVLEGALVADLREQKKNKKG